MTVYTKCNLTLKEFLDEQDSRFQLIVKATYPNFITDDDKFDNCGDYVP